MIALSLSAPEELAEAFYLARLSGPIGPQRQALAKSDTCKATRVADQLIRLHQIEGLSLGTVKSDNP